MSCDFIGSGLGFMGKGIMSMILFTVIIVLVVYWIINNERKRNKTIDYVTHSGGTNEKSLALEILEKRYARGEIDEDEFIEKKSTLTRNSDSDI